jgi:hypothetical protein
MISIDTKYTRWLRNPQSSQPPIARVRLFHPVGPEVRDPSRYEFCFSADVEKLREIKAVIDGLLDNIPPQPDPNWKPNEPHVQSDADGTQV